MSHPSALSQPAHGTAELQEKPGLDVEVSTLTEDYQHAANGEETHSTGADVRGMQRMGKSQQLIRNFRLFSIASFTAIATAAWELGIFLITPALINGGIPSMMYSMIWAFLGFAPVYLSLAEMASMAPIAGAQYHWVSEFAPERYQRILSYITGWTSTIAWQGGNAIGVFLSGTLIQSIISVHNPDYEYPAWHGTLLVIGAVIVTYVGAVYGSKVLHLWQNAVFVVHVAAYLLLIIPIWVKAPTATHEQVWGNFENNGGWSSMGLAVLAGQLTAISNNIGVDTCSHMAEEVKDASRQIPRAMMMVYGINFCLLFPSILTLAYHMPSVEDALADTTTYPAIYVLRQTWSDGGVIAILVIANFLLLCGNVAYMAAVTRDLFAFARDGGFPFSNWLSTIDKKRAIPVNAAILSSAIAIALSLIYLGSPVAFYAITSLLTVALLQCYCVSIGCVLWRRIYHPDTLPPAHFSLGRFGIPINIAAVVWSFWAFFWAFWPQTAEITPADFNWSSVLFVGTLIVAMLYFVFKGKHKYHGPVIHVEGRKAQ